MAPNKKKPCCDCICFTKSTLGPKECPGHKDGRITEPEKNCPSWKPAPVNFTPEQAVNYARYRGIPLTRPTAIKWARQHKIGRQIGGKGSRWLIDPVKFKKLIEGEG